MRAFPHVPQSSGSASRRTQGSPAHSQQQPQQQQQTPPQTSHHHSDSFPLRQSSLSSESSQTTAFSTTPKPSYAVDVSESSSSIASTPRNATPSDLSQQARTYLTDSPIRQTSGSMSPPPGSSTTANSRSRQHSQGFFEPTLPTASHRDTSVMNNPNLSASQIAAMAAMHVQNGKQHDRKRSQTAVDPPGMAAASSIAAGRKTRNIAPIQVQANLGLPAQSAPRASPTPSNVAGSMKSAASTAASAAYPRSPLGSPFIFSNEERPTSPAQMEQSKAQEKEKTSRRKMFLKPSKLTLSKDKEASKTTPKTAGIYGSAGLGSFNHSTTSLADLQTPATAIFANPNASTSTLVPSERGIGSEREKEKHRHNPFSRAKHKTKDDHAIALSSASSNSQPINPAAPQPLYSFAPSSPSLVSKSISGLDLRHGGRALMGKKKEKEPVPFSLPMPQLSNMSTEQLVRSDAAEISNLFGPMSNASQNSYIADIGQPALGLTGFGLQGMGIDDAWPLLKARLLNVFEGEDLRTPIEDFNRLAVVHLQRCIARRTPAILLEDVRELFNTGFSSLDQVLRSTPDERIVPHLVETWAQVFGTILPFMQAVFLPLDLEFRGHGNLLKDPSEAAEFWGSAMTSNARPGTANTDSTVSRAAAGFGKMTPDIRTMVLYSFRSCVILPRHDVLLTIFSRFGLDTIATPSFPTDLPTPPPIPARPGTAASSSGSGGHVDPSSYNSQGSTLLESSTGGSFGARSRATSNTSAGSFHSLPTRGRERAGTNISLTSAVPPPSAGMIMDSGRVTATATRMLQCLSVLASIGPNGEDEASDAAARKQMERLSKELKLNWLGRSRMGRDRRGLVGTKTRTPIGAGIGVGA